MKFHDATFPRGRALGIFIQITTQLLIKADYISQHESIQIVIIEAVQSKIQGL